MLKKALIIAYYFPPLGMGGVQWTLKLSKYLKNYRFEPIILTVKDISYYAYDRSLLDEITFRVIRTESLDPLRLRKLFGDTRDFSEVRRRWKTLSDLIFIPDNKVLWLPFAISCGLKIIKKIDIIFASSPPYTSLIVGALLKRISGLPLVIDFREAWTDAHFVHYPTRIHSFINRLLEEKIIRYAEAVTCVNEFVKKCLQAKYNKSISVLHTGYNSSDFTTKETVPKKFTITHAGTFTEFRSPAYFLTSLNELIEEGKIPREDIEVNLIGFIPPIYKSCAPNDVVKFMGYLPHKEIIRKLQNSSLLWIAVGEKEGKFMATGKIYEYLGTGKPILATAPEGACANLIKETGRGVVVPPTDIKAIKQAIYEFYVKFKKNEFSASFFSPATEFDHKNIAKELANLFNKVICMRI